MVSQVSLTMQYPKIQEVPDPQGHCPFAKLPKPPARARLCRVRTGFASHDAFKYPFPGLCPHRPECRPTFQGDRSSLAQILLTPFGKGGIIARCFVASWHQDAFNPSLR